MKDKFTLTEKWQIGGMTFMDEKRKLLPVYFHSVGHFPGQKHVLRPEGYSLYQITICTNGKGIFSSNGKKYEINEGDIFFFSPHIPHEYYPLTDDWTTVWVVFDGKETENILKYLSLESVFVKSVKDEETLSEVIAKCDYLYRLFIKFECYRYEMTVTLMELMMFIRDAEMVESVTETNKVERAFAPVIEYIKTYYKRDLSLEDMANVVSMSRSYFCRRFKEEYGLTPTAYLINYRISAAKFLLETTEESLEQIIEKTGFKNNSYFCTTFRKYEGVSPMQYRTRHR